MSTPLSNSPRTKSASFLVTSTLLPTREPPLDPSDDDADDSDYIYSSPSDCSYASDASDDSTTLTATTPPPRRPTRSHTIHSAVVPIATASSHRRNSSKPAPLANPLPPLWTRIVSQARLTILALGAILVLLVALPLMRLGAFSVVLSGGKCSEYTAWIIGCPLVRLVWCVPLVWVET